MRTLPEPETDGAGSIEHVLKERRSVRDFGDGKLTDGQLSQLLWAAQGITAPGRGYRTAPSAGATYPLETYAVTAAGVFHYLPEKHALQEIRRGDLRAELSGAALGQSSVAKAPVTIVFAAVPKRTTGRYGERGIRYIHMEAGHAAQNVHLQAVALGLGSVPVGAFDDEEVRGILEIDPGQQVLYLIPVGVPRR